MGEIEDGRQQKRIVFVTVGTTCFDALVRVVDSQEVKEALFKRGYTNLVIQMGRGTYVPVKCAGDNGSLAVDCFTFSSSIADHLRSASLVISHAGIAKRAIFKSYVLNEAFHPRKLIAGSGSIFETLRLGKPLIVVVNEDLMDNHQSELAEELADRKHLYCASPQMLCRIISDMDLGSLVPYPPGDARPVVRHINRYLGFPDD